MTTFSQLVDDAMFEVKRPDMVREIADYLNQTIRECCASPQSNLAALYTSNLIETQLTATSEDLVWDVPNVGTFQHLLAVRYDSVYSDGDPVYAKPMSPGRAMNSQSFFWYRAGNYVVFKGFGGVGALVSLAYFEYPRSLKYKAVANRKVTWDDETGFTYDPTLTTPELQAAAYLLECNWMLERWEDALKEGLRAKVYKRVGDDTRAARCYSFFMGQRNLLFTSESISAGGWVDG